MALHTFKNVETGETKKVLVNISNLPPLGELVEIRDEKLVESTDPKRLQWTRVMGAPAVHIDTSFRE